MDFQFVLAAVCCLIPMILRADSDASFGSKSNSFHGGIRLNGSIDKVFPLFTPAGEMAWADGWNPNYVYPADGTTQRGLVFRTSHSGPLTWVVSRFDPQQHEISYVISGKDTVRLLDIQCRSNAKQTDAVITHTYVSLSEDGNRIVENQTVEKMGEHIRGWEEEINYFLKTGKREAQK